MGHAAHLAFYVTVARSIRQMGLSSALLLLPRSLNKKHLACSVQAMASYLQSMPGFEARDGHFHLVILAEYTGCVSMSFILSSGCPKTPMRL